MPSRRCAEPAEAVIGLLKDSALAACPLPLLILATALLGHFVEGTVQRGQSLCPKGTGEYATEAKWRDPAI